MFDFQRVAADIKMNLEGWFVAMLQVRNYANILCKINVPSGLCIGA
jgi:hypothetical protein